MIMDRNKPTLKEKPKYWRNCDKGNKNVDI